MSIDMDNNPATAQMGSSRKRKRDAPGVGSSSSDRKRNDRAAATQASKSRSRDSRILKRKLLEEELSSLQERVQSLSSAAAIDKFEDLPLSLATAKGLKKAGFTTLTPIQTLSLPLSLKGKDVLASAPTGSGKTLAFLIPILERLYHLKWGGAADGLGALVLSPTRELAIQIFEVLRKIGSFHTSFSAGLVIGGKDVKSEQLRLGRINILVATPGRLLQHMDQTPDFDTSQLQLLVLDEADRCLDMGFANTLNAILDNLPKNRQTLLFSATQTRKVKDLARLSLDQPEYVAVQRGASGSVEDIVTGQPQKANGKQDQQQFLPKQLEQHYMLVSLDRKLDVLYSFLRTHLQSKILIFFSSCRQVQFVYETFRKLRPGTSLLALHGKQKQAKRLQIYSEYSKMKHAALFATDIAARGLDFPSVDWVVQVDAPEDPETYVHRVGRTARYDKAGNSLLFLLHGERQGVLAGLAEKGITSDVVPKLPSSNDDDEDDSSEGGTATIQPIKAKESKIQSISNQLQSFLFQDAQLKYLGQKAFVSYVRSLFLYQQQQAKRAKSRALRARVEQQKGAAGGGEQEEEAGLDIASLPLEKFAEALGLPGAPKVKFVKEARKEKAKRDKEQQKQQEKRRVLAGQEEEEDDASSKGAVQNDGKVRTKYDRMFERKNDGVLSEHYQKMVQEEEDDDDTEHASDEDDGAEDEDELVDGGEKSSSEEEDDNRPARARAFDAEEEDDFLTLKRANHGLSDASDDEEEEGDEATRTAAGARDAAIQKRLEREAREAAVSNLSKRQLKAGQSKKAMAAAGKRGQGEKLVFDDDGVAHALYELQGEDQFRAAGDVAEQQRAFEHAERERLLASDVLDKQRMKEKRREKKRKMKEREKGARDDDDESDGEAGVQVAPLEDGADDWEEPDWILPGDEDEADGEDPPEQEQEDALPARKKSKKNKSQPQAQQRSLEADEELALRLLSGGV